MMLLCVVQYSKAQAVGTPYMPLQESPIPFSFLAGGTTFDAPQSVENTNDGGYITLGSSQSSSFTGTVIGSPNNRGFYDWLIIKYDHYGKIQWKRLYGGVGTDPAGIIQQTSDGGYVVVGAVAQTSSGNGDVITNPELYMKVSVVKLDASGNITWQTLLPYSDSSGFGNRGWALAQTPDGGYIVGGGVYTAWAARLSSTGTLIWQNAYITPAAGRTNELFHSITATSDGTGYILVGKGGSNYRNASGSADYFIVKINLAGSIIWSKLYGGSGGEEAWDVTPTADGGCIISGVATTADGDIAGPSHGGNDMWIIRLNSAGNIVWQKLLGGNGSDGSYSVSQTTDGGVIVGGFTSSSANGDITEVTHGGNDVWLVKLNSTGAVQWQRLYGGNGNDGILPASPSLGLYEPSPVKVRQTTDGGFIVLATSTSTNNGDVTDTSKGSCDFWLFKIDALGNIISVPDIGQRL